LANVIDHPFTYFVFLSIYFHNTTSLW